MRLRQFLVPAAASLMIMGAVLACGFDKYLYDPHWRNRLDSEMELIAKTADELKARNGKYPSTLEELTAEARAQDLRQFCDRWTDRPPNDRFGRPYEYEALKDHVQVWTLGRDGVPGGSGVDADFEWPFPSGYWISKLRDFRGAGFLVRSLRIAVLAGIPPVLLWVSLELWHVGKQGGGWPRFNPWKALGIVIIASFAGMMIISAHLIPHH